MKRIVIGLVFAALMSCQAMAQSSVRIQAQAVATCGAQTLTAGIFYPATQNLTGTLCVGVVSGGGTSSNFGSAFPSAGTAAGFTDGTNMVAGKVRTPGSSATTADPAIVVVDPNVQAAVVAATIVLGPAAIASSVPVIPSSQYPGNNTAAAAPITASTTGTTAATTATLAGVASKTTFICGFTITSDATAALAGAATVTGTVTGTLNYIQNVGSATSAGQLQQTFNPCIPASAANTGIAVNSVAAGTGGNTAVTAWGYQL